MAITKPRTRKSPSINDVKKMRNIAHANCRSFNDTREKTHQYRKTEQQKHKSALPFYDGDVKKKKKTVPQSSLDVQNSSSNNNGIYLKGSYSSWYLCGICFDYKKHSEMFKGSKCKHSLCSDCISKHVAAQMQQNNLKVNCPEFNCGEKLKPKILQPILPKEVVDRWESVRCESLISVGKKYCCPFKNCSVLLVDDGEEVVTSAKCPSCHRLFCAQCLVPWHARMNCEQFKKKSKSVVKPTVSPFLGDAPVPS